MVKCNICGIFVAKATVRKESFVVKSIRSENDGPYYDSSEVVVRDVNVCEECVRYERNWGIFIGVCATVVILFLIMIVCNLV